MALKEGGNHEREAQNADWSGLLSFTLAVVLETVVPTGSARTPFLAERRLGCGRGLRIVGNCESGTLGASRGEP